MLYLLLTLVVIILSVSESFAQTHFVPVYGNAAPGYMNLNLLEAKVNGTNLVAGDEIGIFDTVYVVIDSVLVCDTFCVGTVVLTGDLGILLDLKTAAASAGVDDPDTKKIIDGFINGHKILYKFWDASEDEEIAEVVPAYIDPMTGNPIPAPVFEVDASVFVSLTATHNYKPKARAGSDFDLFEEEAGQLDGTASYDFEGLPVTYTWTDIDNLGITPLNIANPTFTAPVVNADEIYRVVLTVNDGVSNSKPDTILVTVKQIDLPPVANAGTDFEIAEGDAGQLDASSSWDPDGLGYSFSWVIEPAEIVLDDVNGAKPNFTAPLVTNDKEYLAILTVTNTVSLSDKDTVVITVINYNLKPVADAGSDQEVNEGEAVTLDGSGSSDPDNAPNTFLHYKWVSLEGITLDDDTLANPGFTSPFFLKDSVLKFVLVVNDGGADSDPDTVLVTVKHENLLPVANAGVDFSVNENQLGQLNGSGSSDPDGTISYQWEGPDGILNGVDPTFTAPEVQADSVITFILTVTDDKLATDKDTVEVTIKHVNKKPVANAGTDQEVDESVTVTLDGSKSTDPDLYDKISYKWVAPAGITLDDDTLVNPTFTSPVIVDDYKLFVFSLVVNDGKLDSDTDKVVIKVIHLNIAPVADAGADFSINENTQGNLDGTNSSDFEGKPLSYTWVAPAGFVIDNPDYYYPSFTAPNVERDTVYTIILTVNDGVRNSLPDTVKVTVKHINKIPVANAGDDQTVDENVLVNLDGTESYDSDAYDKISYLWSSLDGAVLDNDTIAEPSFTTPWLMKDSVYSFVLVVNDGQVNSIPDTVEILVLHKNLVPTAKAGVDFSIDENIAGELDGSGSTDPEGMMLTYSWKAPAGFTIDNPDAAIADFTAPEVEETTVFTIVLTVDDEQSENNIDTDTILVTVYHINKQPIANAGTDIVTREQKLVTLNGSASYDPDALDTLTFMWQPPIGITLSSTTVQKPTFTSPDITEPTDYSFILTVYDEPKNKTKSVNTMASHDIDTVVVTVNPNKAPVAAGYNQTVNATETVTLPGALSFDPDGDILTYSWTAPIEITLSDSTAKNPTFVAPAADDIQVYSIALVVADDLGLKDTATHLVTVISNLPPVIKTEMEVFVLEGESVSLDASETFDPNGDAMSFEWVQYYASFLNTVPLENSKTSVVSFTAPEVDELTYMPIKLVVSDGAETSEIIVKVYVKDILNNIPLAKAGIDFGVNEGEQGFVDGSASVDPEGNTLEYLWESDYLVLSDLTVAKPTFTAPEIAEDTTVLITLVVNDGKFDSKPDTVFVTIYNNNKTPFADAGDDIVVNEGDEFTLDGSASSDPDGDDLTYSWSALGITLPVDDFEAFSFNALAVEEDVLIPVVLIVNDGKVNSLPDTLWIQVKQVNQSPVWVSVPKDSAFVGYDYSAEIEVADPDVKDQLTIVAEGLPAWLTLTDNGDGTALIETDSIPRLEDLLGVHSFAIKATDGKITIEETVELTITVKTGIVEMMLSNVKLYPNPSHGIVNVEFNRLPEMGTIIQVYNQLGQSILIRQASSQVSQLNLENNPAGLYFIKITSDNTSCTEKVILR